MGFLSFIAGGAKQSRAYSFIDCFVVALLAMTKMLLCSCHAEERSISCMSVKILRYSQDDILVATRYLRHCEPFAVKQSREDSFMDCFVVILLAMTQSDKNHFQIFTLIVSPSFISFFTIVFAWFFTTTSSFPPLRVTSISNVCSKARIDFSFIKFHAAGR